MLKGSVLCVKLNEKKETEVSVQKPVQCWLHHRETKQIRRWTEVHIPPVRYAYLSTQSPRNNRKKLQTQHKTGPEPKKQPSQKTPPKAMTERLAPSYLNARNFKTNVINLRRVAVTSATDWKG